MTDSPCKLRSLGLLRFVALAIAIVPSLISSEAQAVTFTFNHAPGTSPDVIQGFDEAGMLWSSFLADDIQINIDVAFTALNSDSLGQFDPARVNVSYQNFANALWSDVTSPDDAIASANLPQGAGVNMLLDSEFDLLLNGTRDNPSGVGSLNPYLDTDGDCNNQSVRITTANAKALNLPTTTTTSCAPGGGTGSLPSSDGSITLNSRFAWDFDASDGITAGTFDFVGIAAQGIGTLLGFISGVDVLDFNSPQTTPDGRLVYFNDNQFPFVSSVDLFRFSAESCDSSLRFVDPVTGRRQNIIDWTTGRTSSAGQEVRKFFSIDGCNTEIAEFSTGVRNGDGQRAGSWKADDLTGRYLGIMEASPSAGQLFQFTQNDQRLFDVIGWDLKNPTLSPPTRNIETEEPGEGGGNGGSDPNNPPVVSVPEPSAIPGVAMVGVLGMMLAIARRQP